MTYIFPGIFKDKATVIWEIQHLLNLYSYTDIPFLYIIKLLLWTHLQSCRRWLLASLCLSAHISGTTRLPPGRFLLDFIWWAFIKISQDEEMGTNISGTLHKDQSSTYIIDSDM